jgi:predicted dienelactone hydrolase
VVSPVAAGRRPVILFSHGNFLGPHDYDPLVLALARDGFVLILPYHADAAANRAEIRPNPAGLWHSRIDDLAAALDHLPEIAAALADSGTRPDPRRIGVSGHSFGGHSAAGLMG